MTTWNEGDHPRGAAGMFRAADNSPPEGILQPSTHRFDRDELVFGLKDVIRKLQDAGEPATIRIIGGAAISLLYWAQRGATVDIDAELGPENVVLAAAARTAKENEWPSDWMNSKAKMFLPHGFGRRSAEWVTVLDERGVAVQIATAETLLAMKLNAAIRRRRREIADLAVLLHLCGVTDADAAEEHFRDYYGEELDSGTIAIVEAALQTDVSTAVQSTLDLSQD